MNDWITVTAILVPLLWLVWDIKKELIKKMDNIEMELNKLHGGK